MGSLSTSERGSLWSAQGPSGTCRLIITYPLETCTSPYIRAGIPLCIPYSWHTNAQVLHFQIVLAVALSIQRAILHQTKPRPACHEGLRLERWRTRGLPKSCCQATCRGQSLRRNLATCASVYWQASTETASAINKDEDQLLAIAHALTHSWPLCMPWPTLNHCACCG